MKKLLSDELVAKYRALPNGVWFLISTVFVFFANAYSMLINSGEAVKMVSDNFAALDIGVTVNVPAFVAISCLFSALVQAAIFEIFNHIAAGIFLARFSAKTNRSDIKFRLRLCYIYSNICVGLIGIIYFFTQVTDGAYTGVFSLYNINNDVETILSTIIPFSSLTFFLFIFYEDLRVRFLPKRNHTRALLFASRIYFGLYLVIDLILALRAVIFHYADLSAVDMASCWIAVGVDVLWIGAAFLYYNKLKKLPDDDNPDQPITFIVEEPTKHNIYDDFGF